MPAARKLLDDLLNIEVNTIVKPGMTGRKMPPPGHALLDIFSNYDIWLCEHSGELSANWRRLGTRHKDEFLADVVRRGEQGKWWIVTDDDELIDDLEVTALFDPDRPVSASDFDELRTRARTAEEMHRVMAGAGHPFESGSSVMLQRIIRNCDQLAKILRAHGAADPPGGRGSDRPEPADGGTPPESAQLDRSAADGVVSAGGSPLTSDEIVSIRKVWELGTETIVMQTVVQLDGDVVTRIDEARMTVEHQALRDLHRESVDTALGRWDDLVNTVVRIVGALAGRG